MAMVHDASALLAWVHGEPGADVVNATSGPRLISAINLAEVVQRLHRDYAADVVERAVAGMALTVIPADADQALAAGLLAETTQAFGLSLADRFCLVVAKRLGLPAITADRIWLAAAPSLGVDVRLIR